MRRRWLRVMAPAGTSYSSSPNSDSSTSRSSSSDSGRDAVADRGCPPPGAQHAAFCWLAACISTLARLCAGGGSAMQPAMAEEGCQPRVPHDAIACPLSQVPPPCRRPHSWLPKMARTTSSPHSFSCSACCWEPCGVLAPPDWRPPPPGRLLTGCVAALLPAPAAAAGAGTAAAGAAAAAASLAA